MDTELGERFARTLAAQDADGLKVLLTPHVDFRAMTPGGVAESHDADVVVDEVMLGRWFSPDRTITAVLGIDCDHVGPVDRVGYRFRAELPDGAFIVEQQAYLKTQDDRIHWLRIMCSGFHREA
jgi:hypothetical protein